MKHTFGNKFLPQTWALLLASAGLALAGIQVAQAQDQAAPQAESAAQSGQRPDGQIEMDVVHALDASKALKNDMITAATIQGEVSLSGTVSTEASSELAEAIAAHVAGVTKVNNNLKVGDPQAAQADPNAAPAQVADNQDDPGAQAAPPAPGDAQQPMPAQGQYPAQGQDQAQMAPPPDPNQGQPQDQGQYGNPAPPPPPPGYQGGYQGGYPGAYPPARPQYGQQPQYAQGPQYATPNGPVTIPQGTLLQLRTSEPLDAKHAKDGQPVQFTVIRDVAEGGVLALPKGATVHGVVTEAKHVGSGDLGGSSELALKLTSLDLGGQSYPLDSDMFKVKGPNKAGQTVGSAIGGGILGTIIGCAVGRGVGCAVGAGAGVAAGTAASAASSGPNVWIPAEALVTFHLNTPLTVNPVSAQEAARLAQGLYPGGPNLYRRGYYGGGPYYAGAYPYYGPVYYRPYYIVGGAYYWR